MSYAPAVVLDPPLAVLSGARTPFAKAFGPMSRIPADELGRIALEAALQRGDFSPLEIGEVIFGNVAGPAEASNVSRVIALRAGVPQDRPAHSVQRNCASGMESLVAAWHALRDGRADLVAAGGVESMSNIPLLVDKRMQNWLVQFGGKRHWWEKMKMLGQLRPDYFRPQSALLLGLTDPTCGLNMAQTAEVLARDFGITRATQDEFALQSHQRAVAAWENGFMQDELVALSAEQTGGHALDRDSGPRPSQNMESLAKLRPIVDRKLGVITAGNSCPITDGGVALVLSLPEKAEQRNNPPLGYIKGYAVAGCEPKRMGLGPVFAIDKLLKQTGLKLANFDLIEINEAFAAQVLACTHALGSEQFAKEQLGRSEAIGVVDPQKLNVHGGAIALGHPVGASGTRLVLTLLRSLKQRGLKRGLAALCVGGGQGFAMWLETEN